MEIKQNYCFTIAGLVVGIIVMVALNTIQDDSIPAQRYQSDLNRMTAKIDSLTDSVSSLTKFTLKMDKAYKSGYAESRQQSSNLSASHLTPSNSQIESGAGKVRPANQNMADANVPADTGPMAARFQGNENEGPAVFDEWQIKQHEAELLSSFENHFTNQGRDSVWAQTTEELLASALQDDIFTNSRLNKISCRATLCKIDTEHTDPDAELLFLQQINSRAGFNATESFYTRDEQAGGNIVMTLYISRDGHRLPRFTSAADTAAG